MSDKLYLAPMEEVTGYTFRNMLNRHFGGVDKYFTPFVTPNQNKLLKTKEGRELIPEHNKGLNVVPQILTNNSKDFNELAEYICELGYDEININCGCPSKTVIKKDKGSGILRDTYKLMMFLDGVFNKRAVSRISVKTRIGVASPEEFEEILDVYNNFPIHELIIHVRVGNDMYNGCPYLPAYEYALKKAAMPVCYNGDIYTAKDYGELTERFAAVDCMIGRGAVANPGIFRMLRSGRLLSREELRGFHDDLLEAYCMDFGANNSLFKMKEVWYYMARNFEGIEKPLKVIRKASRMEEYTGAVRAIFDSGHIISKDIGE